MPKGQRGTKKARKGFDVRRLAIESSLSQEDLAYIKRIYEKEMKQALVDEKSPNKCQIGRTTRRATDGYASVKVTCPSSVGYSGTPRTYSLRGFVNGKHPSLEEDYSHLCHNGKGGYVSEDHIVIEKKGANLRRKACALTHKCSKCGHNEYVIKCECVPSCLQPILHDD